VGAVLRYCGRRLSPHTEPPFGSWEYPGKWLAQFHVDEEDIRLTHQINNAWRNNPSEIKHALWVMPDFRSVHNGGPNTILRHAHFLASQGIHNTIVIANGTLHRKSRKVAREVAAVFGSTPNVEFVVNRLGEPLLPELLPESDVCFATIWHSAYTLARYHRTKAKFYLIQDYESLFYPANVEFGLAAQTYEMGFLGLFNTPGLAAAVRHNHPIEGRAFVPGIDPDVFYPAAHRPANDYKKVFFYGRPEVPRNGYELGIAGVVEIQKHYRDVEVFIAGHHGDYKNIGLRAYFLDYLDYRKTGDLYRSCDFVVGFMFTPHPSYIPLQAMACGAIPICVDNPYIRWAIRDKVNAMAVRPSPQAICEAYTYLRDNPEERRRMRDCAAWNHPFRSWEAVLAENLQWILQGAPDQPPGEAPLHEAAPMETAHAGRGYRTTKAG
jgi:glycosyltransferase involved in cell wall biosynthesis